VAWDLALFLENSCMEAGWERGRNLGRKFGRNIALGNTLCMHGKLETALDISDYSHFCMPPTFPS